MICSLLSEISCSINNSKKTLAVFLNLAKAFDAVPHGTLLEILRNYGVRGPVFIEQCSSSIHRNTSGYCVEAHSFHYLYKPFTRRIGYWRNYVVLHR